MKKKQYKKAIENNRKIIAEILQDKKGFVDNISYIEALTNLSKKLAEGEVWFCESNYKHIF